MIRVKNVQIHDFNGQLIEVDGVLSKNTNFVVAAAIRKLKNPKSQVMSTGEISTVGMGDLSIFGVKNAEITGNEAVVDMFPIMNTTSVSILKFRKSQNDEFNTFPSSINDYSLTRGKNNTTVGKMSDILNSELQECITETINIAATERSRFIKNERNAKLAKAFMDTVPTESEKPSNNHGMTVAEVIEQEKNNK